MTGTIDNPWDLATALAAVGSVRPGDKLWLRGGTYPGTFEQTITGNASKYVTIENYPGERPVINGTINIRNPYTRWRGIEFRNSTWTTRTDTFPTTLPEGDGVNIYAIGTELLGCIVHDNLHGILATVSGARVEGCLLFNNGILKPGYDPGYYHNMYLSGNTTAQAIVRANLIAQGFSWYGLHAWNESGPTDSILAENNVVLDQLLFAGAVTGDVSGILARNNELFRGQLQFGWSDEDKSDAEITGNYSSYGKNTNTARLMRFKTLTFRNNTLITDENVMRYEDPTEVVSHDVDLNTYISTQANPWIFGGVQQSFASWQSTYGFDANGSFAAVLPTTNRTRIIPLSDCKPHLAIIAIYNWQNLSSVDVDLSSLGLANGNYELLQAQDPLVDITNVIYDGSIVSIDMQAINHSVAVPIGHGSALVATSFPVFGAFMLRQA